MYTSLIKAIAQGGVIGAIVAVGFSTPVFAQATGLPGDPVLADRYITCEEAAALFPSFPKSPRTGHEIVELNIGNPPTSSRRFEPFNTESIDLGGGYLKTFSVGLKKGGGASYDFMAATEIDPDEDQIADTPGIEILIVRGSKSAHVTFQINQMEGNITSPDSSVTAISACWAAGPCGLRDTDAVTDMCNAFNNVFTDENGDTVNLVDIVQGKRSPLLGERQQPLNLCGCGDVVARWCDSRIAAGIPGSCNQGNTPFQGNIQTSDITGGSIISSMGGDYVNSSESGFSW